MRSSQQESISHLNFIKQQAREQAAKDIYHCPVFDGARNTFEETVFKIEYNKAFARELENEC